MLKTRSSTFVFGLAYVVLVVGVFLALGGAAYAADGPTAAADQYETKVVEVTTPSAPTEPEAPVSDVAEESPAEEAGPFLPPEAKPEVDVAVTGPSAPPDTGAEVADVAQTLPSTGLSLLATALVGGGLIALGVALRRRERRGKG